MTRAERSIRAALNYYGPGLRAGHWAVPGSAAGSDHLPQRGYLRAAFADIDSNGLVYDIRLYAYGEVMLRSDGEVNDETRWTIDITDEIEDYLTDRGNCTYDDLVNHIALVAYKKIEDNLYNDACNRYLEDSKERR